MPPDSRFGTQAAYDDWPGRHYLVPTMNIRITRTSDDRETVLRVDGRLDRETVADLAKEHRSVEGLLVLELSELQSADPDGVELLLELVSLGAQIRGASPYIELLLKGSRDCE